MRSILTTVALFTAAAGGLAVLPSAAPAGSYVVSSCSPSGSPGLWTSSNRLPAAFGVGHRCGGPVIGRIDGSHDGALYAEDIRSDPMSIPNGSRAGWTFTAPAGTTITAISYYRRLAASGDPDLVAGLYQGNGLALEECDISWPAAPGESPSCSKPNTQTPVTFTGLSTTALFLGVGCRVARPVAACGGEGTKLNAVQADLYSASVTLAEDSLPTLSNVGGGLWGAGVVSGVVPVTFAATDPTGIQEQSVRTSGGSTLVSVLQSCDFTAEQPCPQQPVASLNVDTTRVPDGTHTFELVATDAAGNTQTVTSPPVVVDNDGPPPPVDATVTPAGDAANTIALTWRNPLGAPAPITRAMVQICQATCPPATSIAASGAAKLTAPGPGLYSLRLWLLDTHGRGGPHNAALASVRIAAPPVVAVSALPAPPTKVKAVIVGRRLRVSGTIARTGRVRVSWQSKRGLRTLGSGSRVVTIREHTLTATFVLSARARSGITRVTVTSGSQVVTQARARRI